MAAMSYVMFISCSATRSLQFTIPIHVTLLCFLCMPVTGWSACDQLRQDCGLNHSYFDYFSYHHQKNKEIIRKHDQFSYSNLRTLYRLLFPLYPVQLRDKNSYSGTSLSGLSTIRTQYKKTSITDMFQGTKCTFKYNFSSETSLLRVK